MCKPISIDGNKYFITFISDFSRFGWIDLLQENCSSLDAFKFFIAIDLEIRKKIKCMSSHIENNIMVDIMKHK